MAWTVRLTRSAEREFTELPEKLLLEADEIIESLADDPRPPDSILMTGFMNLHRIRLEGYRIVYRVNEKRQTVLIDRIRPRPVAYRGLEPLRR